MNCYLKIKSDYSTEMLSYALVTLGLKYIWSLKNFETFSGYFLIKPKDASKCQSENRDL